MQGILFFTLVAILFLAVLVHEFAHGLVLWRLNKRVPHVSVGKGLVSMGTLRDYTDLSAPQKYRVYAAGVVSGALVILFYTLFWNIGAAILYLPYMLASWRDLRQMWALGRQ